MSTAYPLIHPGRPDGIFALHEARPVRVADFLRDATNLAALLPARRNVVNLCRDRYRFAVAFAAALMREQLSLMPPSDAPGILAEVATEFDDLYCLHDDDALSIPLPSMAYPADLGPTQRPAAVPSFPAHQPAVVLFTSGSSGRPTAHQKPWGSLVLSAGAAGAQLGVGALSGATVIGTVPQQHSYGLESTVLLAMQHGLVLHGGRPFYPADVIASIAAAPRPRLVVTTPIHLRAILADSGLLPGVDLMVSATAPLSPQLATEAELRFGAPLLEIYGCSEAGQLAVRRTASEKEWHCLDGIDLHQDEAGTWASGSSIKGKVLLGDIIEWRGSGRFLLHGRAGDLVNIAGKRTSLGHLNHHLNAIAGVRDGIFVMPDKASAGVTRLMAFVVAPGLTAETILAALRARVDAAFLPRPLLFVDELPRNPVGKLPRAAALRLTAKQSH